MIILGVESSATSASAAVIKDGKLLSEFFSDTGLTHSQTLLPIINGALSSAEVTTDNLDLIAVSNGPGSFTGVRIGIATIKGIAFTKNIPCAEISTLECMAYNVPQFDGIVCATMDARCNQVYTALFDRKSGCKVNRLTNDTAMPIDELGDMLIARGEKVILVGDGAEITYNKLKGKIPDLLLSPSNIRKQRASSVALCAESSEAKPPKDLSVNYIRLPQAQRELAKKKSK